MKSEHGIEKYAIESVPTQDWEFTQLLDDIIMCRYIDADDDGNVKRNGIFIPTDATKQVWRVAEVIMVGDTVPDYITPGVKLMFPSDKGIPAVTRDGTNIIFLNVERIFGIVERADEQTSNIPD
tara:strand:+ start:39 stop:410 length:372 start_codon:yes stop_codon:yes gene_type:complete